MYSKFFKLFAKKELGKEIGHLHEKEKVNKDKNTLNSIPTSYHM